MKWGQSMRQSVSAIFCYKDQIFSIIRQNHLSVFPGYLAFPGGKVDKADHVAPHPLNNEFDAPLMNALVREMREELFIDLPELASQNKIAKISYLGVAVTPEFNPYRFENFYFKIDLTELLDIKAGPEEARESGWSKCCDLLTRYQNCEVLAVPPMVEIVSTLGADPRFEGIIDLKLKCELEHEVPMIESLYGVKQFLPLSHTFPPANRTNCFLMGDTESTPTLIDPSPRDENEYQKLKTSLRHYRVDQLMITHHHPDHHEFAPRLASELKCPILLSRDTHSRILERHGDNYFNACELLYIAEGEILCQSRGQDILIYEVPGHDEGQLALAPRDLHWFLVGDLIQTVGTVVIGHPEGDMSKYFSSLKRVIELAPRFIIPSHGIAIGGTDKLEMTLAHRRLREQQILDLYLKGSEVGDIMDIVYEGLEVGLQKYALKTIDAHLRKLAHEGKCDYSSSSN